MEAGNADLSPDGHLAVVSGSNATLWNVDTGDLVGKLPGWAYGVAISPDGYTALTAGEGNLRLWDIRHGALLHHFDGKYIRAAISPDGQTLLAALESKLVDDQPTCEVVLLDVMTGEPIRQFGPVVYDKAHRVFARSCPQFSIVRFKSA